MNFMILRPATVALRDTLGLNTAGLRYIQHQLAQRSMPLFADVPSKVFMTTSKLFLADVPSKVFMTTS